MILAEIASQASDARGIVKRERSIEVCSALDQKSPVNSKEIPMIRCPIMSGTGRSLFFGERQKLRGKLAHRIAIERHEVRDPKAVEDGEQQQRVFGGSPSASACSINEMCPLGGRLGFRRGHIL